jgi:hypothetical protein
MDNVPGFIKITRAYGFNYLATPVGIVGMNEELFLRRNGDMISLGTYRQAQARIGGGHNYVLGIDGTNYGNFGTPEIEDNLFISANPRLPLPPGQRNIPTLQTLAKQALYTNVYKGLEADNFPMPPGKLSYSDGSNQNAGNFKHRKSRSKKSRSKKSRSKKSRSRKSRSRRVRHR